MKQLICEMCGGTDLIKEDSVFVCQNCGTKYSVEEAKKMMIEGTVDVQGTVKVDNSAFVEKYLANARRALAKEDWEEVEKYYNMIEQNVPNNIEAVFFSSYGKAMLSLSDSDYFKRKQKFDVLNKSMEVISDYYEETNENKEEVLRKITSYIDKMFTYSFVFVTVGNDASVADLLTAATSYKTTVGGKPWCENLLKSTKDAFVCELRQIKEKHNDAYLQELIDHLCPNEESESSKGCYVATAVYGSYDCPQVWTLRRYRDNTLAQTWYGRAFIHTYYAISPTLVKWFGHTEWFKNMWRGKLDRMVSDLQSEGVEATPYKDKEW